MSTTNNLDVFDRGEAWPFWNGGPATTGLDFFLIGGEAFPALFVPTSTGFTPTVGGGVQFGGQASVTIGFPATVGGGIQLGGTTTPSGALTVTVSGGVQFGGQANPSFSGPGGTTNNLDVFDRGEVWPFWNGGQSTAGLDIFSNRELFPAIFSLGSTSFTPTVSGGVQFGGTTSVSTTSGVAVGGGVQLGGAAAPLLGFTVAVSGGVQLGGAADPVFSSSVALPSVPLAWWFWFAASDAAPVYNVTVSGGVQFGGQTTATIGFPVTVGGGVQFGGVTQVAGSIAFTVAASGGLSFGGSVDGPRVDVQVSVSGGVQFGGSTVAVGPIIYGPTVSGGVQFGGSTVVVASPVLVGEDLLSCIRIRFLATDLPNVITGGLFAPKVGYGAIQPYAVVWEKSSGEERRSDITEVHKVTLGFRVYAYDLDVASRLTNQLVAAMHRQAFSWPGARSSPLLYRTEPKHDEQNLRGVAAQPLNFQEREMYCRVLRDLEP